ncbi:hypothetical protein GGI24_001320 [Coemansia furcata]|nr:hypothetical protein GGI24_001320 [Coemansia furcata]
MRRICCVVSSLTEYDDEFTSIDVVDDTDCCEVARTDDGCSDDAVDDCAEYDCGFGTTDVKVGEIDVCDDVEDESSAEAVDDAASAVDDAASAVYAEVNDVADDSANCEEVADGNSVEVRDGAVSDGSVSTKSEDEVEADTVGVEVADSCSLPYFEDAIVVLIDDGDSDGDGDDDGDGEGSADIAVPVMLVLVDIDVVRNVDDSAGFA